MRDIIEHYGLHRYNVHYGGLVELIVNAMTKYSSPYMEFLRELPQAVFPLFFIIVKGLPLCGFVRVS